MPESEIVRDILQALDAPLMTVSLPADRYNEDAYLTDPSLIEETFGTQVDLVIDGGTGCLGETTIVDCHDDEFNIIRQGNGILQ